MFERQPQEQAIQHPIEIVSSDGSLKLRQFTPQDINEVYALIDENRSHLSQYGEMTAATYPNLQSVKDSIVNPPNPNRLRFAIRNESGEYMGTINLTPDRKNQKRAQIGYYLGKKFTGQGFTRQAVSLLVDFSFSKLDIEEIYGRVHFENVASLKTLLSNGFEETAFSYPTKTLTKKKT